MKRLSPFMKWVLAIAVVIGTIEALALTHVIK